MAEEPYLSTSLTGHTPLWPAGHLPFKGGDHPIAMVSSGFEITKSAARLTLPISPPEGEMAGRPEEAAKDRRLAGDDYAN